jgi:hypothetical protein
MRIDNAIKIIAALFLLLTACKPLKTDSLDVSLEIDPKPARKGKTDLTFALVYQGKAIAEAEEVMVEGNMIHAGMEPIMAKATRLVDGRYQVKNYDLMMGGDWVLTFSAKVGDKTLSGDVPITVQAE